MSVSRVAPVAVVIAALVVSAGEARAWSLDNSKRLKKRSHMKKRSPLSKNDIARLRELY